MVELHKIALWSSFCPCNIRLAKGFPRSATLMIRMYSLFSFSIQCDGKDLRWKHILDLYYRNTWAVRSTPGLSLLPKLTFEHVMLTSFSKIRVDLAAQVRGYVYLQFSCAWVLFMQFVALWYHYVICMYTVFVYACALYIVFVCTHTLYLVLAYAWHYKCVPVIS